MPSRYGYREIEKTLRQRISDGRLPAGSRLPGEQAIAAEFGVARGTARTALQQLELAGLARVVPGRGRFVAGQADDSNQAATYERVAAHVRSLIKQGRNRPGAALPSESDLREELGVSRNTVRRAYELLVAEGLVERRQGVGAFVADVKS